MNWKEGIIHDCVLKPLGFYKDHRGWLAEIFRTDEMLVTGFTPAMSYLSCTLAGITRGPHEHVSQTDMFVFFHGTYRVFLWDNRADSPSFGTRQVLDLGEDNPAILYVPPKVVHGYQNIGDAPAFILNNPDRLYAGEGKKEPVDEIRHETDPNTIFIIDTR